jgi:hypothetical protein
MLVIYYVLLYSIFLVNTIIYIAHKLYIIRLTIVYYPNPKFIKKAYLYSTYLYAFSVGKKSVSYIT